MLNWALAAIAAALWSTAYGWYFSPDLRRWLWWRRNRKRLAEQQRVQAYAAWMRRTPLRPRTAARATTGPPPPPPRPPATVIPFPDRTQRHTPPR